MKTCAWCHGGIIACAVRWGYHHFCSDRCVASYLGWAAGALRGVGNRGRGEGD